MGKFFPLTVFLPVNFYFNIKDYVLIIINIETINLKAINLFDILLDIFENFNIYTNNLFNKFIK